MDHIESIKAAIEAEQNKTHQLIVKLGKTFYEVYGSRTDEEPFLFLCEKIKESQNKIKALRDEIQEPQDSRQCPDCGSEIIPESKYCMKCGRAFSFKYKTTSGFVGFCTVCGAQLIADSAFCVTCGTKAIFIGKY